MSQKRNTPAKADDKGDEKAPADQAEPTAGDAPNAGDATVPPEPGTPEAAPTEVASADADAAQPLAGDHPAPEPTRPADMPEAQRFGHGDVVTGPPPEMTVPAAGDMPFERAVPRDADVEVDRALKARHTALERSDLSRQEIAGDPDARRVQVQVRQPVEGDAPFDAHERFQELWAAARAKGGGDVRALGGTAIEVSHKTYKALPAGLRKELQVVGGTDPDAGKE